MAASATSDRFAAAPNLDEVLDASISLLHACLEGARFDRTTALALCPLPAAVLARDHTSDTANDLWRTLFLDRSQFPRELSDALESHTTALATGRIHELEIRDVGHRAFYALTLRTIGGGERGPATLVVCREVTERVIARRLGVDPETLLWRKASGGDTAYYSPAWTQAIGCALHDAWDPDEGALWSGALETLAKAREVELDAKLRTRTGAARMYRVRLALDNDDSILGCAQEIGGASTNIDELLELRQAARAAYEDAQEANRMKDEFLATVSHELRAPLTTLLLWEKVLRESTDESSRAKALDAIHQSANMQARLVADLLDIARGVSGKLYLDIRVVDIQQLVVQACEAARPSAAARSIDLVVQMTGFTGTLHGDGMRLRQILDNLLSNAIKFTDEGGRIIVSLARRGPWTSIDVEDNGRGIAPDLLTRIFEPFTQVDDALTRAEGGLGLGLAIARRLAELHRGALIATSPGIGQGSRFRLNLPAMGSSRAPSPPVGVRSVPRLDGAKVLMIDDDSSAREALALLLSRAGARVFTADSAAAARTVISGSEVDVLICDIAMPGEDGYTFVRSLRKSGSDLPAIALTAYATENDAHRALEAGFDLHIAKPIHFDRLMTALSDVLATRKNQPR